MYDFRFQKQNTKQYVLQVCRADLEHVEQAVKSMAVVMIRENLTELLKCNALATNHCLRRNAPEPVSPSPPKQQQQQQQQQQLISPPPHPIDDTSDETIYTDIKLSS